MSFEVGSRPARPPESATSGRVLNLSETGASVGAQRAVLLGPMRWQPQSARCEACSYEWSIPRDTAVNLVRHSPVRLDQLLGDRDVHAPIRNGLWSPVQYLWHMVDVLRIGTERLMTVLLDPQAGVPSWYERDLAQARGYAGLSPVVGLSVHRQVVETWVKAAYGVPEEAETHHAGFGTITALDIIRRNAHEIEHHLMDIAKGAPRREGGAADAQSGLGADVDRLVEEARKLPPAKGNYLVDDLVTNLLATVVDFQMDTTAVENAMRFYELNLRQQVRTLRDLQSLMDRFPNDKIGNTALAEVLWGYDLWTRAEMLRGLVTFFDSIGVRDQAALRQWAQNAEFKRDFEGRVFGLGPAVFQWLVMRQGGETVKPDVHVRRFAERALGRRLGDDEVVKMVTVAAEELGMKAYELDWAIWEHERGVS